VDIFAETQVQQSLQRDFSYIFSDKKYPGIPEVKFHTIHTEAFQVGSTRVVPIRLMHYKLPILGFRVKDFTYLTDTNFIPAGEREKLVGTKYLVIDALRKQKHISHYSLQEALKISEELAPRRTYFIHMSHRMGLHGKVLEELPKGVELAYDGLVLEM
jgi:phosphoribosyl 1,2-cyclic phosphate phosphodiesterase